MRSKRQKAMETTAKTTVVTNMFTITIETIATETVTQNHGKWLTTTTLKKVHLINKRRSRQ